MLVRFVAILLLFTTPLGAFAAPPCCDQMARSDEMTHCDEMAGCCASPAAAGSEEHGRTSDETAPLTPTSCATACAAAQLVVAPAEMQKPATAEAPPAPSAAAVLERESRPPDPATQIVDPGIPLYLSLHSLLI